jgi:predicted HicB family RNase H-like nuclease
MAISTKKPAPKTPEDFIRSAKADQGGQENLMGQKDKTFLLRIPHRLHEAAKKKAGAQGVSLHDFILQAVNAAITKS